MIYTMFILAIGCLVCVTALLWEEYQRLDKEISLTNSTQVLESDERNRNAFEYSTAPVAWALFPTLCMVKYILNI